MLGPPALSRRQRTSAAALAGYASISFVYLGLAPLVEHGSQYVGEAYNPQIFIWAFAWWPHAILHGENPFFTHAVWAPVGVNTMWSTTVPGLSLLFSPLTLLVGPVLSYDIAAVAMPALAAWTAFLLCRRITSAFVPSLLGGYLFGFSSYVLAQGGGGGNLNLSSVFLLPLVALVVLRFLDEELGPRGLVARLAPILAFQLLISAEVAFTVLLALAVGLLLGFAFAPARRRRLVALLPPLVASGAVAGVLTAPFLYYLVTGIPSAPFYAPDTFIADLANFVVPTKVTAVGGSWLTGVSARFPGNTGEQDAYLGLPALVIVGLYARTRMRTSGGRFLVAALVVGIVASLGGRGTVAGRYVVTAPWALLRGLPVFDNVLTGRFPVYISLVAAIVAAQWVSSRRPGLLRLLLPLLAVVAIVPNPAAKGFATTYRIPPFFEGALDRACLTPGETVLALPLRGGSSLLWQVESKFRFNLAGGDIGPDIPGSILRPGCRPPDHGRRAPRAGPGRGGASLRGREPRDERRRRRQPGPGLRERARCRRDPARPRRRRALPTGGRNALRRRLTTRRRLSLAAAGLYGFLAFLYLGLPPLVESGRQYVGYGYDPQIFIWAFAWWPHAILHGQNPFVTHEVWSPAGLNLTWTTTVPGLALVFAPLTLLAGPIVSYDVAAVLMPALSAWTAFLLCRHLTRAYWPALVGGYLFGFSSYLLAQGGGGHLHLSAVFVLPLVALVVLRFVQGELGARALIVRLGPLLALQMLISTEVLLTLSLALAASVVLGYALVPDRRPRLISAVVPVLGAYAFAALLTAPFLYFLLDGFYGGSFGLQDNFVADLANFVVPTRITAIGGTWLTSISSRFPGNPSEQDAYLGAPLVLILILFARERLRSAGGRFVLCALVVAVVACLGARAKVDGRSVLAMPWMLVHTEPLFDNVLTTRLPVFVSILASVAAALWIAGRRHALARWGLPALAVLALVPNPQAGGFATTYSIPPFFTATEYRDCLDPGEVVVPFPFRGGQTLLWQVDRGFRFRLAGGDLGPAIPGSFYSPPEISPITGGSPLGADQVGILREFLADKHVTSVVVDASQAATWSAALNQIARPHAVGGVLLYHLTRYPPPCP